MKTTSMVVVVAMVLAFSGFATSASAAGGTPAMPVGNSNLSDSINLPGFNFSYYTSQGGSKTNFDAYLSDTDRISSASMSISRNSASEGWINAYFSGIVGDPAVSMASQQKTMSVDRHGVNYGSDIGLSSWQEVFWTGGKGDELGYPVYGDWYSSGSASATLFNVTPIRADANYNEWFNEYDGATYFNANVNWQVVFNDTTLPAFGITSSVPEPATMSLLAMGGLGMLLRRRNRR